jgi:hypothetical protein
MITAQPAFSQPRVLGQAVSLHPGQIVSGRMLVFPSYTGMKKAGRRNQASLVVGKENLSIYSKRSQELDLTIFNLKETD